MVGWGAGVGMATLAVSSAMPDNQLKAEKLSDYDVMQRDIMDKENRIRQFSATESIFYYFASYQYIKKKEVIPEWSGRYHDQVREILMSVKDFYNSVTPNSSLTHGTGQGIYTLLKEEDIGSDELYEHEHVPVPDSPDSLLNKIQREGLLTYADFTFLLHMLSTPKRYMDIAFYAFDIQANGVVEAKEFAQVMCNIINYRQHQNIIEPKELLDEKQSGLMTYLFGKDRSQVLQKEDFQKIHRALIDDLLWLEFTRYSEDKKTISTIDFCNHLLANNKIPKKKQQQMVKRVERYVGKEDKGVTFAAFRGVGHVLFAGADLERSLYFLDKEKAGIDSTEFKKLARCISNLEVDSEIVEVLYVLLDDDYDGNLSNKEFNPILFKWRNSRGFQHSSLQVSLGELKI